MSKTNPYVNFVLFVILDVPIIIYISNKLHPLVTGYLIVTIMFYNCSRIIYSLRDNDKPI